MIDIKDKSQCTGCTACESICGKKAITMQFDEFGHSYPHVNKEICVECGLCETVCPMLHKDEIGRKDGNVYTYAAYNKDLKVRKESTSGGIFTLLAEEILLNNGVVFAARFDEEFHVIHDHFDTIENIGKYRGSKYVQSSLNGIFKSVKEFLKVRKVLFVGTPCQVEGLKRYLRKDNPNLVTCDFICMCISSPRMWDDYLKEYHTDVKLESITFKDKRTSWHKWNMLIKDEEGEHLMKGNYNPFFYTYLNQYSSRPSCFKCPFRRTHRNSDFTIADCWGIDKVNPDFDDDKGCTTLIVQSLKGKRIFEQIKCKMNYIDYKIEDVRTYNPYIEKQLPCPVDYNLFNSIYIKSGFSNAYSAVKRQSSWNLMRIKMLFKKIFCKF